MNGATPLLLILLAGCVHAPAPPPPTEATPDPGPVVDVAPEPAPEGMSCGKLSRKLLRLIAAAEGSILRPYDVARERRAQIERHNADKTAIDAAFKRHPCLELAP